MLSEEAAQASVGFGPEVRFADARGAFAGHEACALEDEWINATIFESDSGIGVDRPGRGSFHPKASGHDAYADVVFPQMTAGGQVMAGRSAVVALALGVVTVGGCTYDDGPFPASWDEVAADPLFDIVVDGAEPGRLAGHSGSGGDSPLVSSATVVSRRWESATLGWVELLARAVDQVTAAGAEVTRLLCDSDSLSFYGRQELVDGEVAGLELTARDEVPAAVTVRLMVEAPDPGADGSTPLPPDTRPPRPGRLPP